MQVADWNTGFPLALLCALKLLKGVYPWFIWDQTLEQQTNSPAPTGTCALWTKGFSSSLPESSRENWYCAMVLDAHPGRVPDHHLPWSWCLLPWPSLPFAGSIFPSGTRAASPIPLCNIPDFVLLWRFWAAAVGHLQLKPPCPATLDLTPSVSGLLCHLSHTSLSQFYHLHFPKSGCCLCELLWVLRHCWLNREVPSCPHHPTSHCWWPPIPHVPHPWGTLWIFYPGDDMEYPLYNPPEPPNATCCVLGTGLFKEKGSESQMLQTHSRQTPEECWTHTIRNLFG